MLLLPVLVVVPIVLGVTLGRRHANPNSSNRQSEDAGGSDQCEPGQHGTVTRPAYLFDALIAEKVAATARNFSGARGMLPQWTDRSAGKWQWFSAQGTWTSGFFPAELYEMNKRTKLCESAPGGTDWLALGRQWSSLLVPMSYSNSVGHDVGFVSFAFSDELAENSSNKTAQDNLMRFANQLADRYSPTVGCTRSWDSSNRTSFQVIMDNMMNLDLLYQASKITGNDTYKAMAVTHADKTLENHIRPDGGSYHVVEYNANTGGVTRRYTAQGYADNSTWSRGQAWGIYGFAMMYANQAEQRWLDGARRMATYFKDHTPTSGVIPWDFNAPSGPTLADTSAAMIAANAMLLLSRHEKAVKNSTGETLWRDTAVNLLDKNANFGWRPQWESLFSNGTVNNPAGNNLTGTIYGDYYFIKAGNALVEMGLVSCT